MSIAEIEARLRANLDDWDHWRIYGDWLSDRGDLRGQIIALCHRRALGEHHLWREIHEREQQLDKIELPGVSLETRCGFPVHARGMPQSDLDHPGLVLLCSMELQGLALTRDALARVLVLPRVRQLTSLFLQNNRLDEASAHLLAAAELYELAVLDLRYNPIGPEGARALASAPSLVRLHTLYLNLEDIGPEGAAALASSPHLPLTLRRFWKGR